MIMFILLLFSCQSRNNNLTIQKKYSDYTVLEKMNLKGDIIGFTNYDIDTTSFSNFSFINDDGNLFSSYIFAPLQEDGSHLYEYTNFFYINNLLILKQTIRQGGDNNLSSEHEKYSYSEKINTQIIKFWDEEPNEDINYVYDKFNYPIKKKNTLLYGERYSGEERYFWTNKSLDSIIRFWRGNIVEKQFFKENRLVRKIDINENGEIIAEKFFDYKFDNFNNDVARYEKDVDGNLKDSVFRIIKYKGDDISYYVNKNIEIHLLAHNLTSSKNSISNDYNITPDQSTTQNNYNNAPQQQEKRKCYSCNGTGQCPKCAKPQRVRYKQGESPNDHNESRFGMIVCTQCGGNLMNFGADKNKSCYLCKASGWLNCPECNSNGNGSYLGKCQRCKGTGFDR